MADNPGAFPFQDVTAQGEPCEPHFGMTLRDWFAGQALAGMLPNEDMPWSSDHAEIEASTIANAAYELADAMLAERSK